MVLPSSIMPVIYLAACSATPLVFVEALLSSAGVVTITSYDPLRWSAIQYQYVKQTTTLFAKGSSSSAKKKSNIKARTGKKTGTGSAGGFGKVIGGSSASSSNTPVRTKTKDTKGSSPSSDEDYSVFPALEPNIAGTLIPCPDHWTKLPSGTEVETGGQNYLTGDLPQEIYDRLDQIYGFPDFNYPSLTRTDDDVADTAGMGGDSVSFGDLLSASPSGGVCKNTKQNPGNNFVDLLTTITAEEGETSGVPETQQSNEMELAISSLPPFTKFRVLHVDPLVMTIDDFFTDEECDRYVDISLSPSSSSSSGGNNDRTIDTLETRSKTVGKDAAAKAQRTSTTWFHQYRNVPELMAKASRLIGLDHINHWEEPQTVRYRRNEKFTWHLDALAPQQATPESGGQRTATLLVYLKDLETGGATIFRDLVATNTEDGSTGPLKV